MFVDEDEPYSMDSESNWPTGADTSYGAVYSDEQWSAWEQEARETRARYLHAVGKSK